MALAAASHTASSRLACGPHGAPLRSPVAACGAPRALTVCSARSGYEQRPTRPSPGGYVDDASQSDMAPGARPSGNNGGGERGGYAPRQGYQSRDSIGGGGQGYDNNRPRRQYNNNNNAGQEGGAQGEQRPVDYRPRRQYNNNRDNSGGEGGGQYNEGQGQRSRGGNYGGGEGGGGEGRAQWNTPRMSPEELAMRAEVNNYVRNTVGWKSLSLLLTDKGPLMDAENISSLFQKVSKDPRPQDPTEAAEYDGLLSALLGWVLALLPTFRPKHTAMNLVTLGKLQLYSPEVVTALMDKAATQMINFSNSELVQLLSGCSALGHAPTPEFLAEIEARTGPRLSGMRFMELSSILASLHRLNALPIGRPWFDTAMQTLLEMSQKLPATQEAANALIDESKARSGFQDNRYSRNNRNQSASPSPPPGEDGQAQQPQQPQQQEGQQYRQRYTKPQDRHPLDLMLNEYQDACMTIANIAKDTGYQPSQELVDALFTRQIWRVMRFKVDTATRLLWVVSNLGARPSKEWFDALMTTIAKQDRSWDPTEIASVCLYLSKYLQQYCTPQLANKLLRFTEDNKFELGPDGVASVLYLLGMSGFRPGERWLDDILIWLKPVLGSCSVIGLEMLYLALPRLGGGFRLNEVVTEAANRYNMAVAQPAPAEEVYETQAV